MLKISNVMKQCQDYEKVKDRLPDNTIFVGYRGSQAYGMYVPSSNPESIDDIDLMGVYIAPVEHYLGFGRKDVHESFIDEYDIVSYELRKFMHLLLKNNPNVLSMLWLENESHLYDEQPWGYLMDNRNLFASKLAYHSFSGYAHAQLKKMTAFNQKFQEELKNKELFLLNKGVVFKNGRPVLKAGEKASTIELARQYNELMSKFFSGYMGEKRKNNVIKYGFDTKNAAHLIRLLRMAKEFLETGEFIVKRPDAQELLDIKQGKWKLEDVQSYAEFLSGQTVRAYENSTLPEHPDKERVEELLVKILEEHFYG